MFCSVRSTMCPASSRATTVGCTASTNASGSLTLGSSTPATIRRMLVYWMFTPDGDPEKIVVEGVIEDVDYLRFGYWVETTTDNDQRQDHLQGRRESYGYTMHTSSRRGSWMIRGLAFRRSLAMPPIRDLRPACSQDARTIPRAGVTVETAGRFTADATLTADFDAADHSIDGSITNFMHAGSAIDPEWSGHHVRRHNNSYRDARALRAIRPSRPLGDGSVWTGQFNGHYATSDNDGTPVNELDAEADGRHRACSRTRSTTARFSGPSASRRSSQPGCRVGQAPSPACCADPVIRRPPPTRSQGWPPLPHNHAVLGVPGAAHQRQKDDFAGVGQAPSPACCADPAIRWPPPTRSQGWPPLSRNGAALGVPGAAHRRQ